MQKEITDDDTAKIQAVLNYWFPWADWDRHTSN